MSKVINFVILPMIVAILAGVFLYHYQKFVVNEGQLVFSQSRFVTPSYDGEDYQFSYVTIINHTDMIQSDIELVVKAEADLPKVEILTSTGSGKTIDFDVVISPDNVLIKIASLRPKERISFQLLLRTPEVIFLDFFVGSSTLIGVETNETDPAFNPRAIFEVISRSASTLTLIIFFLIVFKKRRGFIRSANDVAFSLLHSGAVSEAKKILIRKVFETNSSVYELTNYACCLAIEGDLEGAERLIEASVLLNGGENHDNILLARLIYTWKSGDVISARNLFDEFRSYRVLYIFSIYHRYESSKIMKQLKEELVTG